jgi:hypothetical protein
MARAANPGGRRAHFLRLEAAGWQNFPQKAAE